MVPNNGWLGYNIGGGHQEIVTMRDNRDYIRVLSYSYNIPLLQGGESSFSFIVCGGWSKDCSYLGLRFEDLAFRA